MLGAEGKGGIGNPEPHGWLGSYGIEAVNESSMLQSPLETNAPHPLPKRTTSVSSWFPA